MNSGIQIYFFHGVLARKVDPLLERNFHLISAFRAHLRRLRRARFVGAQEFEEELTASGRSSKPAVMITFDDGYANNLEAAEILSRERIPWCLFVSTGALGRGKTTWPCELALLLLHGRAAQVSALNRNWPLGSRAERVLALEVIRPRMKAMASAHRLESMEEIRRHFPTGETARLLRAFPSLRSLSWNELRQLAQSGVEIGSHGVSHEIHHRRQPAEVCRFELVRSAADLRVNLGVQCRYFAYPNGDHSSRAPAEVEAAGYRLAFTTDPGLARASTNRFLLPRCEPEAD